MAISKFNEDLAKERRLARYLDRRYADIFKGLDVDRVEDEQAQYAGVDLWIVNKEGRRIAIDEKAQLSYVNQSLPTFAFEISYLKGGNWRKGWLFDDTKLTEYYVLITSIKAKDLQLRSGVQSSKITLVDRQKLIALLEHNGLTESKIFSIEKEVRLKSEFGKIICFQLNPQRQGYIYYTEWLEEQPVNIVLRLSYLVQEGVAWRTQV